jgi:hypothetical protein
MPLGKPDVTKFDSDDDSIKDARPEMQTAFTSLNTIIDDYNANGESFGTGLPATYETETFTTVGPHVVAVTDGVVNEYLANGSGGTNPVIEIDVQNFTGQGYVVMKNIGSANATFRMNRGSTNHVDEVFITNGEAVFVAYQFAGSQSIKAGIFIPDHSVNSGVSICF